MMQTKDAAPEMKLGQSFTGVAVPPSFVLGFIAKLGQQERFCKNTHMLVGMLSAGM